MRVWLVLSMAFCTGAGAGIVGADPCWLLNFQRAAFGLSDHQIVRELAASPSLNMQNHEGIKAFGDLAGQGIGKNERIGSSVTIAGIFNIQQYPGLAARFSLLLVGCDDSLKQIPILYGVRRFDLPGYLAVFAKPAEFHADSVPQPAALPVFCACLRAFGPKEKGLPGRSLRTSRPQNRSDIGEYFDYIAGNSITNPQEVSTCL